jgi:hypothetical protein
MVVVPVVTFRFGNVYAEPIAAVPIVLKVVVAAKLIPPRPDIVPVRFSITAPEVERIAFASVPPVEMLKVIPARAVIVPVVELTVAVPVVFDPPVTVSNPPDFTVQAFPEIFTNPVFVEFPIIVMTPVVWKVPEPEQVRLVLPVLDGAATLNVAEVRLAVPFIVMVWSLTWVLALSDKAAVTTVFVPVASVTLVAPAAAGIVKEPNVTVPAVSLLVSVMPAPTDTAPVIAKPAIPFKDWLFVLKT